MRQTQRGLGLAEALLTLALVGVFLVMLSDLTGSLRNATEVSDRKEKAIEGMESTLATLRRDLWNSVELLAPTSTTVAALLQLEQLRPEATVPGPAPARLELPVPARSGFRWDPAEPSQRQQVTYERRGDYLVRQIDSLPEESLLKVSDFRVTLRPDGILEVELDITNGSRTTTVKSLVEKLR